VDVLVAGARADLLRDFVPAGVVAAVDEQRRADRRELRATRVER
jgi:hypothetical protein